VHAAESNSATATVTLTPYFDKWRKPDEHVLRRTDVTQDFAAQSFVRMLLTIDNEPETPYEVHLSSFALRSI